MQPYIKAMAWAFWRERRMHFTLFIVIASAFSIFMRQFNPIFEKYQAPQLMTVFALFIELFSISMLIIAGLGSSVMHLNIPDQLYVKPVSSRFLVSIYFILSILTSILIHMIAVLLYRFVGHLDWPVIIPLIFLISIILCAYTAFWSFSDTPFLCAISTSIVCGFFSIFSMEYIFKRQVSLQYFLLNIMPYMLIIDIFALVVSFHAIKHARYGEKLRSANFWERLYLRLKILLPGKSWQLKTPQKAYFWFLFRNGGLFMPYMNLLFILITVLVFVFMPAPEKIQAVKECMITFAFLIFFIFPFIGALMAHQEDKSSGVSFNIAARPISDRSLVVTIFKVFITSYIIGWITYFIGLGIILTLLLATGYLDSSDISISELQQMIPLFSFPKILLYPLGIWTAVGLTGSLFMSGRKWLIFSFFSDLFILSIILMLTGIFGGKTLNHILHSALIWLFAFGSIGGTLLAFVYAVRRGLLSSILVGFLIAGYIICCVIGLLLNLDFARGLTNIALLCGLIALPFAPFATAPLALYWNRHR